MRFPFPFAMGIVLILWLAYTGEQVLYQTGRLRLPFSALLELIPGLFGVAALLLAGFTRADCFLRLHPLSKNGLLAFLLPLPLYLPIFLTGTWVGWNAAGALVFAPTSAIAQELFFRSALLPVFLKLSKGWVAPAILLNSLLFALWHIGPLAMGQPWFVVLAVMLVPGLCGLAWSWQVQHNRTVFWLVVYHAVILVGTSLFTWG